MRKRAIYYSKIKHARSSVQYNKVSSIIIQYTIVQSDMIWHDTIHDNIM